MTADQERAAIVREGFMLKAYRVYVTGFNGYLYYAGTRGKALRDAWHSYCSYRHIPFKEFLQIARLEREEIGGEFGEPITVTGKPAFFVSRNNQYVQFVRPFATEYFHAHPFDVEPEHMRPWTYRSEPRGDHHKDQGHG